MSLYSKKIVATIEVEAVKKVYKASSYQHEVETCSESEADMFSVYLRTSEGLAKCIADFDTKKEAIKFSDEFEPSITYGDVEVTVEELQKAIKEFIKK